MSGRICGSLLGHTVFGHFDERRYNERSFLRNISLVLIYLRLIVVAIVLLMSSHAVLHAQRTRRLASGVWGGEHIQIKVGKRSATVEFDCAHGTIHSPLTLDARNRFTWTGTLTLERGGPVRIDVNPEAQKATYAGSTSGDTMKLNVTLTEPKEEFDSYLLKRGALGSVVKCL